MNLPSRNAPNPICSRPVNITIVNASAKLFAECVITTAIATAIGAVGPDTMAGVPPKIAANKAIAIAAYIPATAPTPDATPKAVAIGNAITAAVIPPKISPFRNFAM